MPTTDFFSGPGFEPEDVPVKKTSPAQQPVEKQPADDEPFAGMQKLDFDFLGGDDPAVPGETDPGDCLLYTSDAADDLLCGDLGGRRIIKKKKQ